MVTVWAGNETRRRLLGVRLEAVPVQVGARVAMHPATDAWMRGDRFGTVERLGRAGCVWVRLDRSGRLRRTATANLETVAERVPCWDCGELLDEEGDCGCDCTEDKEY